MMVCLNFLMRSIKEKIQAFTNLLSNFSSGPTNGIIGSPASIAAFQQIREARAYIFLKKLIISLLCYDIASSQKIVCVKPPIKDKLSVRFALFGQYISGNRTILKIHNLMNEINSPIFAYYYTISL